MEYEDLIEGEPQPDADLSKDEIALEPIEPKAKSPWKAFILTGFLAGLIGAVGGGYGAYAGLKKFSPAPVAQDQVDLSSIETKLTRLTERVTEAEAVALEAMNTSAAKDEPVDMSAEFSALEARLTALETNPEPEMEMRLTALEDAPSPEIDPDALSALQAAQKDGFEWPDTSAIEARISGLEAQAEMFSEPALGSDAFEDRISVLEARVNAGSDTAASALAAAVPSEVMERLKTLETDVETFRNAEPSAVMDDEKLSALDARLSALENRPAPTPAVETVAILAFPKAQMISAVEANMDGGMIKKTLSRHIRVKDANDPLTLIDGIELDLSEGQLAAAAEKFERLPSPVRSAGQAWYESVKASL